MTHRRYRSASSSRERRPSPDKATSNIDPMIISTPPAEWSKDQFIRGIERLTRGPSSAGDSSKK